jgi:hypothetical protein
MPRCCVIVVLRAAWRDGKKSAAHIKQATISCVKRDALLFLPSGAAKKNKRHQGACFAAFAVASRVSA